MFIDAVTLVPPSITTCPGQTVMFNCTSYGFPVTWSVFTPNMNYTNLEITDIQVHRESVDEVIMADLIFLDSSTMPITVMSSLTVNVTEGSIVQCLGTIANGRNRGIKSGFIHITGNYLLIRHIIKILREEFLGDCMSLADFLHGQGNKWGKLTVLNLITLTLI